MPNPDKSGKDEDSAPLKDPTPSGGPDSANQWIALLNLGWVLVATMAVTVFGGVWLDKRYGTAPLFILLGVALGFAMSGYSFYRTLRKLNGNGPTKPQE